MGAEGEGAEEGCVEEGWGWGWGKVVESVAEVVEGEVKRGGGGGH